MKISQTVFELQSGHDFVTDRRTDRRTDDQGKNNMSPNPTGGDMNIRDEFHFCEVHQSMNAMGPVHVTYCARDSLCSYVDEPHD